MRAVYIVALVGALWFGGGVLNACAADDAWLETGLPPLIEREKPAPFEVVHVKLSRNQVDQELLRAECRRSWLVRILPEEVKLVILPARGGRYAVHAPTQMVNGPRTGAEFGAVVDNLLDYRGELPGGARVYLEMRASSPFQKTPPMRLSKVLWLGTREQLAAAQKQGPPPALTPNSSTAPETTSLPEGVALPEGAPVKYLAGDRWRPATVAQASEAQGQLTLLVFFARPGKLYLPWTVQAERRDVRMETAALAAFRADPNALDAHREAHRRRMASLEAPSRLRPVGDHPLEVGQRLLTLTNGNLNPVEVTGPVQDGAVRIRDSWLRREVNKPLAYLYLDPQPAPAPKPEPPKANPSAATPTAAGRASPQPATTATNELTPVPADAKLQVGDKFKAKWGNKWWDVEVVKVQEDGKVKIHYTGWGDNWDEVRAPGTLFRAAPPPDAAANQPPSSPRAGAEM